VTHTYGAGNYRATVRVTDSRGKQSNNSAGVNIEVTDPQPPAAPGNLVVASTTSNSITLSWTDNADTETGFKLERCLGTTCTDFQQLPAFGSNVTSYTDSGLKTNATYRYRLRSFNGAGNSAYSNIVSGRARK
jgi:predicted phage tail protein